MPLISEAQWTLFDKQGFVVLPTEQVFPATANAGQQQLPQELAALQRRIDDVQVSFIAYPVHFLFMTCNVLLE